MFLPKLAVLHSHNVQFFSKEPLFFFAVQLDLKPIIYNTKQWKILFIILTEIKFTTD